MNAADSGSSSYTLSAYVTAPAHGETVAVAGVLIGTSGSSPTQISNSVSYGSGYAPAVAIGVPLSTAGSTGISDTLNFVALAN